MGTSFNYDDTSHQVIFDHINGGAGSDALQETSRSWQRLGDGVGTTCKSYVQSAIGVILTSRQGAAAEEAAAATGAMLPWMDTVVQTTATVAQRAQGQADHWVTAKNSVPPVPPTPKSAGFFSDPGEWATEKTDWFPGVTSDEEKAQQHQQDAAEQAREAMRVYQSSSNGNIDLAPAFTPPQALDSNVGALPLTAPRIDHASAAPPTMAGGGAPAPLMAAPQPVTHQPAAHQPPARRTAAYQPAATVAQLAPGTHAATVGNVEASPGRWAGGPTTSQGLSPGALPVGTGFSEDTAGRGRSVSAGGGARLAGAGRGASAGHSGFGPRPSTAFGPRPTASAHPSLDSLDEMSGSRGAGSASSTRGAGGVGYEQPFAGGASQRGEQDREHRSKYLLHNDSHAIVGDLPPTAPPVIGADY